MNLGRQFHSNLELERTESELTRVSSEVCFTAPPAVKASALKSSAGRAPNIRFLAIKAETARRADKDRDPVVGIIAENLGIGSKIGHGRFGTVFIGLKVRERQKYAIKVYNPYCHQQLLDAKKPGSELYKLFKISHPLILKHHGIILFDNKVCRLVEYQPKTLFDVMKSLQEEGKPSIGMPEEQIKVVMVCVITALQYLHDLRIVHGNLHYKNIFIDGNVAKISDIESMTLMKHASQQQALFHLPFMAPELHKKRMKVSPASDVWNLGVCLHFMAVGCLPFTATTCYKIVRKIRRGLKYRHFEMSVDIQTLLVAILRAKPAERVSLGALARNKWVQSAEFDRDCLKEHHESKLSTQVSADSITRDNSKGSIGSNDEGYTSANSEVLRDSPVSSEEESEEAEAPVQEVVTEQFAVFVGENNRKEWENVERIERCKMSCGKTCIKIYLPAEEPKKDSEPTNAPDSALVRAKNRLFGMFTRKAPIPEPEPEMDYGNYGDYGDYALLNFGRETTGLENTRNYPKFNNRKEAQGYFSRIEGTRLWSNLKVVVCDACEKIDNDSMNHDEPHCLYKLLTDGIRTEEIVEYRDEDYWNIRLYSVRFRRFVPTPPTKFSRLCRGSKRFVQSSCSTIANKLRRSPAQPQE